MSRILFIMPGVPLSFNYAGASSRYTQNFLALKSLGVELHVVRFHLENQESRQHIPEGTSGQYGPIETVQNFERSSETTQVARQYAASWDEILVPANQPQGKWGIIQRIFFDPIALEFPFYVFLADQLRLLVHEIAPDLIWAEHSDAAAAIHFLSPSQPWVYSATDLRYLIHRIRNQELNIFQKIIAQLNRTMEIKISQSADLVVTGSTTEAEKLRKTGCKTVRVIPMASTNFPEIDLEKWPFPDLRIIHLGSVETTANRHGLTAYLSKAHQKTLELCDENHASVQLVIVGDSSRIKPPLSELLLQENIVLTGYISDLSSILRPFDIAILPYTQDSGYRTKLPLLMGYAQVIIATRAAVAGSLVPGLEDVCILLDKVDDFPEKIAWLSTHPDERRWRGAASLAFAQQHFSLQAVLPFYADLLMLTA